MGWLFRSAPARPDLFDRATAPEALGRAWRRVKANGGGAGGDGVTIDVFSRRIDERLSGLGRDLALGHWRPGPLREIAIAKPNGGQRLLAIPPVVDRVVLAAVAELLSSDLDPVMNDGSFGYRPGRSVAQAAERVRRLRGTGHGWVVDGDIRAFFASVPHGAVLAALRRHNRDRRLTDLITAALARAGTQGLPQGSPLSPVLANLVLAPLDEDAAALAGAGWVRYCDDFVMPCRDQATARRGLEVVARSLARAGSSLHPDKTAIVPSWRPLDFLGITFPAVTEAGR